VLNFDETVNWLHADIPLFLRASIGNIVLLKHRNVIEAPVIFEHLPVEKKTKPIFFTGKYFNHFIFLNVYINQKKLELYSHKQAFLL
jgi:hypothetical protein